MSTTDAYLEAFARRGWRPMVYHDPDVSGGWAADIAAPAADEGYMQSGPNPESAVAALWQRHGQKRPGGAETGEAA